MTNRPPDDPLALRLRESERKRKEAKLAVILTTFAIQRSLAVARRSRRVLAEVRARPAEWDPAGKRVDPVLPRWIRNRA